MKRIVILQPSYLPWIGYFDQIIKSDQFIYLDDVLYTKNDWRNRNKIKTANGTKWLTLSVDDKNRLSKNLLIKDVKIKDPKQLLTHLEIIKENYQDATYFKDFFNKLGILFNKDWELLTELNIEFINLVLKYLNIKSKKFIRSSELKIDYTNSTDRLIKICKLFNATHYLTGDSAKNYLDEKAFEKNKIIVEYHNYKHPLYPQLWGEFVPYLSIVDLLLNNGKNSNKLITNE